MNSINDPLTKALMSPEWRLVALVPQTQSLRFSKVSEEDLSRYNFVDHEYLSGNSKDYFDISLNQVQPQIDITRAQSFTRFIYHTAFCGSTLIARMLGEASNCISIREPAILMQLSSFKIANPDFNYNNSFWRNLLLTVIQLLSKPYNANDIAVIKLSNTMNNLIEDINHVASPISIVLFTDLKEFIISNLKKGSEYIEFIDKNLDIISSIANYGEVIRNERIKDRDAKVRASIFHVLQQDLIYRNASNANFKKLNFNTILSTPKESLTNVFDFFAIDKEKLENIDEDQIFNRAHSKLEGVEYTPGIKNKEDEEIYRNNKTAIDEATEWGERIRSEYSLMSLT